MLTDTNKKKSDGLDTFSQTWFLSAGLTDARGLMPITLVAARAIELATNHANSIGIGYTELAHNNIGWVLARLSIEMVRYPGINETYSMTTWIEGYNRYFCDRCFEMTDSQGKPLAYIRSMWVAINMDTREMADLSALESNCRAVLSDRTCPLDKCRAPMIEKDAVVELHPCSFGVCDIDFNRHVNTIRYLEAALNLKDLDFVDKFNVRRLDVSFEHECVFGEHIEIKTGPGRGEPAGQVIEFHSVTNNRRAVALRLVYEPAKTF